MFYPFQLLQLKKKRYKVWLFYLIFKTNMILNWYFQASYLWNDFLSPLTWSPSLTGESHMAPGLVTWVEVRASSLRTYNTISRTTQQQLPSSWTWDKCHYDNVFVNTQKHQISVAFIVKIFIKVSWCQIIQSSSWARMVPLLFHGHLGSNQILKKVFIEKMPQSGLGCMQGVCPAQCVLRHVEFHFRFGHLITFPV